MIENLVEEFKRLVCENFEIEKRHNIQKIVFSQLADDQECDPGKIAKGFSIKLLRTQERVF